MGDRGNIIVDGVYLYSHWTGSQLPSILQEALKKQWRWDDGSYLTRIIFCEMVKDDIDGETGYGISNSPTEGLEIIVNSEKNNVEYGDKVFSFKEFIALSDPNEELLGGDE